MDDELSQVEVIPTQLLHMDRYGAQVIDFGFPTGPLVPINLSLFFSSRRPSQSTWFWFVSLLGCWVSGAI